MRTVHRRVEWAPLCAITWFLKVMIKVLWAGGIWLEIIFVIIQWRGNGFFFTGVCVGGERGYLSFSPREESRDLWGLVKGLLLFFPIWGGVMFPEGEGRGVGINLDCWRKTKGNWRDTHREVKYARESSGWPQAWTHALRSQLPRRTLMDQGQVFPFVSFSWFRS